MKARTVIDKRLKIYKFSDGNYEAIRNNKLYTFRWEPYKVYNFKAHGTISPYRVSGGKLVHNPPIQMILQIQHLINSSNIDIYEEDSGIQNIINEEGK